MGKLNRILLIAASTAALFAQYPVASGGGGVGGAGNLNTVGAVPYVSASGVLNQDTSAASGNKRLATSGTAKLLLSVAGDPDNGFYSVASGGTVWALVNGSASVGFDVGGLYFNGAKGIDISGGAGAINITNASNVLVGNVTTDGNYKLDVTKSGSSGTLRVYDQTPTTGSTLGVFTIGAAQTTSSIVLSLGGVVKFAGSNTTGVGSALLGANSPAVTLTAPYTWIKAVSSDGSTVYIPAWK
jgi:hypothetical protein